MRNNHSFSILTQEINTRREFQVYTHDQEGQVVSVSIPARTATVNDAIAIAVQEFNNNFSLSLPSTVQSFKLYAANPNGSRVKEYPSLEQSQELRSINLGQFYLRPRNKIKQRKTTITSIKQSRINSAFDCQRRPQRKVANNWGCFCFSK